MTPPTRSAPRAVTLDAAGTIIGVAAPVGETYAKLAAEHGIDVDAGEVSRAFRTVFPRMTPLAFGAADASGLERQERDWWKTLVRAALGRRGQHPAFPRFFDTLYEHYRDADAWRLYDDVTPLLDALDERGVPAAVVSNFDSRLTQILDALGIAERFVDVLCSSRVGAAKPDPRIFRRACEALECEPYEALHAGDDRHADRDGARGAGMQALWLRRDGDAGAAEDEIAGLGALIARLDRAPPP